MGLGHAGKSRTAEHVPFNPPGNARSSFVVAPLVSRVVQMLSFGELGAGW
jgi:hypothetical protein